MYSLAKEFKFTMGHRLSLHKGLCKNFHGHNYIIIVGVKSKDLNENGMVIDFSHLKAVVSGFLDGMDHALMLNETDEDLINSIKEVFPDMKIIRTPFEPTAENMAREIYDHVGLALEKMYPNVKMDYVTVYENDSSMASYDDN